MSHVRRSATAGANLWPERTLAPSLARGTPVLAICDRSGPLGREMEEAGLGRVLEWDQIAELPRQVEDLMSDPERFRRWQENCLSHARTYHRDHAIPRMDALLRDVARG